MKENGSFVLVWSIHDFDEHIRGVLSNFVSGLNTSGPHDQALHLDLAFLLPLVLPAGLDDHLDHHILSINGNFDLCQWDPA